MKTHYPVSGLVEPGIRLKALLTQLNAAWNALATERSVMIQKQDFSGNSGVKNVTGAVTASGLIKLTVTSHGYVTGNTVVVKNVGGTAEANGGWPITVVDANTFTLDGSVFTNAYTSGGTVQLATVWATIGEDYFLGANATEKQANAARAFAEIDSAYSTGDPSIRQMIGRTV